MQNSFNPSEVSLLVKVVDAACLELGCIDDTERQILALRVLDCADQGELDFDELLSAALGRKAA